MDELYLYNTLTRKKEKFVPIKKGYAGIYVCGPTVYGDSHLGHAKSYISFDVIVRYFRFLGYKVRYVQNITDVGHLLGDFQEGEDRILQQARLEQTEPMQVVETYTRSYFEDMDCLGLVRPDISPRASGHIIEQIEMIKILLQKGQAYEAAGNVYFDVYKFPGYGKLSGRKLDELEAGARVEVKEEKKHPADFALWKAADEEHLMRWPSPWGEGYPGWHIECSCMATKYLGETFDIHGGGLENVFPHHECEIAQSESATGKPFARYWLHNNMVTVDGIKMGKSLKNFLTIKEGLKRYDPLAIRYFVLTSHYRSPIDFSDEALEAAAKGLKKIHTAYLRIAEAASRSEQTANRGIPSMEIYEKKFRAAMNDDFNTPQAIAALFDLLSDVNKMLDKKENGPGAKDLEDLLQLMEKTSGNVLGILPDASAEISDSREKLGNIIDLLLHIRTELRQERNFALSDKIRDTLTANGIIIKDTAEGPVWQID